MTENLTLKWGTLKAWSLQTDKSKEILERYLELRTSFGVMTRHDSSEQQMLICELIDAVDCDTIYLSWDDIDVSKDEAKKYIREYR